MVKRSKHKRTGEGGAPLKAKRNRKRGVRGRERVKREKQEDK